MQGKMVSCSRAAPWCPLIPHPYNSDLHLVPESEPSYLRCSHLFAEGTGDPWSCQLNGMLGLHTADSPSHPHTFLFFMPSMTAQLWIPSSIQNFRQVLSFLLSLFKCHQKLCSLNVQTMYFFLPSLSFFLLIWLSTPWVHRLTVLSWTNLIWWYKWNRPWPCFSITFTRKNK